MRKQKLHCNKKELATREQHVAKPTATSTKDEREQMERERARVHFRNSNFEESFSCDMKNNIEFSCRLLLLLLQFYMQLKNSNKEEKPGKC